MRTRLKEFRWFLIGVAFPLMVMILVSCASMQETNTTYNNRQAINAAIPIPQINYSSRRWVLIQYYSQVMDNARLRTCTMITPRGGSSEDVIAIAETIGPAVNLSNQVTNGDMEEPDSVYPGLNDQTVFVLRNGFAVITEADTTSVIGDCPPGIKPDTIMQQVIDYQAQQPEGTGQVNFLVANP